MNLDRLRNPEAWKPYVKEDVNQERNCNWSAERWRRCLDGDQKELDLWNCALIKLPPIP